MLIRTSIFCALATVLAANALPSAALTSTSVASCTTATKVCEQWVAYGTGPARSMTYSTHSLDTPNASVTRALIMIHGAGRNADHYFATATAAGFLAGA